MIELAVIAMLLVANGVFAMAEIALVASRRVRLEQRAGTGDASAAAALTLKADPTDFLSTVQVGITLIGILAGAYSGAAFAAPVADVLGRATWLAPYSDAIALGLVVSLLTFASLIIGELVPKALALRDPERVAAAVARPFAVVARVTSPLVRLLSASTNAVLWILRLKPAAEPHITEEEIRALITQATHAGEVRPAERAIVEEVFRLGDRRVSAIMTPRYDIDWVDINEGRAGMHRAVSETRRSRLLFCDGDLDHVVGLLRAEDLLAAWAAGQGAESPDEIRALVRPVTFVPETLPALALLDRFRAARSHTLLAVDEFGAVQGLVTLSDVLEALLGAIPDSPEPVPTRILQRPDGSWLVDGDTPVEDLHHVIPLPAWDQDMPAGYETLAGLVMTRLARVPRTGDAFEWGGWRFEVVDMDGRRVDKVLIAAADEFR
jgi:putative hemolysin